MSSNKPTLHLVCGKIAAGKSTLVTELGLRPGTVIVREEHWLSRLYPGEQNSLDDYVRNSTRLQTAIWPHLIDLLRNGLSVALEFPANTPGRRAAMRKLFESAGYAHQLHYLDATDDVCKSRLRRRNQSGDHEFVVSDEDYDRFTSHFVPPSLDESFEVLQHRH